jgi:hypothetical protein
MWVRGTSISWNAKKLWQHEKSKLFKAVTTGGLIYRKLNRITSEREQRSRDRYKEAVEDIG